MIIQQQFQLIKSINYLLEGLLCLVCFCFFLFTLILSGNVFVIKLMSWSWMHVRSVNQSGGWHEGSGGWPEDCRLTGLRRAQVGDLSTGVQAEVKVPGRVGCSCRCSNSRNEEGMAVQVDVPNSRNQTEQAVGPNSRKQAGQVVGPNFRNKTGQAVWADGKTRGMRQDR